MYRVLACVVLVLRCVSVFAFQEKENVDLNKYFSSPRDRNGGTSPRIIGGEEVSPHSYPFQAAVVVTKDSSTYICGGTLISPNLVLTAAHCVDVEVNLPDFIVVCLGLHYLDDMESKSIEVGITARIFHQDWNSVSLQNDIALVRMSQNITFNEYIQPVKLATGTDKYEGKNATLLGWGETETGHLSRVLRKVETTIMTNKDCANTNEDYEKLIVPSQICTSGAGPVGACYGDAGGPLVVDGVLVGIASFATANCTLGLPSVFTRVSEFNDWIQEHSAN